MKDLLTLLREFDPLARTARRILIATDFDGTLCPIASLPSAVTVDPAMLSALRVLQGSERVAIGVVSGRGLGDLTERLPFLTTFAGNHGLEIQTDAGRFTHPDAEAALPRVDRACSVVEAAVREWRGAWVERKGLSATLHYRNVEQNAQASLLWTARRALSTFGREFALRSGKMALEIRPNIAWDKGSAMLWLKERLGPVDLTICLGDDRTDESMFNANTGQPNIHVGTSDGSSAGYRARNPVEVAMFFWRIAEIVGDAHAERATA